MANDFLKLFKYDIGAEQGEKANPKTYTFEPNPNNRKAVINFDFSNINGDEEQETSYKFTASLTEEKIQSLISRNYKRDDIRTTNANSVDYSWSYLPYHYNETWQNYNTLVTQEAVGVNFVYFIYSGYYDDSDTVYDSITYELLKNRYPLISPPDVRPPEPNVNELIYKISLLEKWTINLEDAILNEEESQS